MKRLAPAVLCVALAACTGRIRDPEVSVQGGPGPRPSTSPSPSPTMVSPSPSPSGAPVIERSSARRLTRSEFLSTLRMVFGAGLTVNIDQLPEEALTPFDNDVQEQSPSMRLVEASEAIGAEVATWVLADPQRIAAILPCQPSGPSDAQCFAAAVEALSRALFRTRLDAAELASLSTILSDPTAGGTFEGALGLLIRVLILHPYFLYRVESGTAADPEQLSGFEIATRLSLMLVGHGPDKALLDAAEAGTLATPEGRRAQAERLLSSAEGQAEERRFVSMWLGYSRLAPSALSTKMRAESDALVDRAFADGADYRALFSSDETYVDAELAQHYGLSGGGATPAWISYGTAERRGILSQGSFAIAGAKFGDTSPTRRGKFTRERLFCESIPPPMVNVDVDQPPATSDPQACKIDRYTAHRANTACAGCHARMDPIGFGLENLDHLGRWRTHDEGRPECMIAGAGALDENTPFVGPKALATIVAASPKVDRCLASHLLRFAAGRRSQAGDEAGEAWLTEQLVREGYSVRGMLLAYAAHPNFAKRKLEP
ncbi:MAG: DUF1588 domain-containing protein [Myxococcota bacterium]